MASITKETVETNPAQESAVRPTTTPTPTKPSTASSRPDAVSLEVPVRIHGSRATTAGQTEPFEEQTTTMIVFPQGGVLRMVTAASVGQMLVVTNQKSRQDAICRVVKVRSFPNMQSYVEVEFTHAQAGYWGVYFPSEASTVKRGPSAPAAPSSLKQTGTPAVLRAPSSATPPPASPASGASPYSKEISPVKPSAVPPPASIPASALIGSQEKVQPAASAALETSPARPTSTEKPTYAPQPLKNEIALNLSLTSAAMGAGGLPVRDAAKDVQGLGAYTSSAAKSPTLETELITTADSVLGSIGTDTDATDTELREAFRTHPAGQADVAIAGSRPNSALIGVCLLILFGAVVGGVWYFHSKSAENGAQVTTPVATSPNSSASSEANQASSSAYVDGSPNSAPTAPTGLTSNSGSGEGPAPAASTPAVSTSDRTDSSASKADAGIAQPPASDFSKMLKSKMKAHPLSSSRSVEPAAPAPALDSSEVSSEQPGALPGIGAPGIAVPPPPGSAPDGAIKTGGKATEAKLISAPLPVYPSAAKQSRIQGDVVIDTQIDKKGNVVHMEVVSGPEMLRQSALDALRRWKYKPSQLDGQPVAVEILVSIKFRL